MAANGRCGTAVGAVNVERNKRATKSSQWCVEGTGKRCSVCATPSTVVYGVEHCRIQEWCVQEKVPATVSR